MELRIDERRLVELALRVVSTPSFTGSEQALAELMQAELAELGLHVQWQQVEEERANVLGTWEGSGGGPTLMLNGHMDTSYSGREPWLQGIPGFQPAGFERDGRISSCSMPASSSSVSAAPWMFWTLFARYMPAISRAPSRPASRSDSWIEATIVQPMSTSRATFSRVYLTNAGVVIEGVKQPSPISPASACIFGAVAAT